MATKVYRDYGALNGMSAPNEFDLKRYTQVYQATHEGEKRLPFMNRSFISFSYGYKLENNKEVPVYIEDFNLLATVSGDRLERNAYGEFSDLTSTYDVIQGQFYWGTHFQTNSITFDLATDGMTQQQLDDFKYWFRPGQIKELILAEHPNRAIMARVSSTPQLSLLPFEHKISMPFQEGTDENTTIRYYETSTTLYRGEITLEFVMDEPFWYAKKNILGIQDVADGYYSESWVDANNIPTTVKGSKDALKIIYEDRIPLGSTTKISVFLGGDTYATIEYKDYQRIVQKLEGISGKEEYEAVVNGEKVLPKYNYYKEDNLGNIIFAIDDGAEEPDEEITYTYYKGAAIAWIPEGAEDYVGGKIGGTELTSTAEKAEGISLDEGEYANLYYAGNAPSPVKLQFTLKPKFAQNFVLINPNNKYGTPNKPYSTITLTATRKHEFQFSLPTIFSSYNQVLKIFDNEEILCEGNAWLLVRETIRDTIKDPYVRAWASKLIDCFENKNAIILAEHVQKIGTLKYAMETLFVENNDGIESYTEGMPASFMFDGKTGIALGKFKIRNPYDPLNNFTNTAIDDLVSTIYEKNNTIIEIEQNVGDMVKSNYLILDERNKLNDKFQVQEWTQDSPENAYIITHDLSDSLDNLHFEFQNLYL